MTNERKYSLDVLRILATVLIVFHHYGQVTGLYLEGHVNYWNGRFYFGYMVEFFFLLSGYFMYRYVEKIHKGLTFKKFFLPRALRLLPLVLISGVVYEVLLGIYQKVCGGDWFGISITVWGVIINALGVQDGWVFANPMVNNPTWYISVLLLCYIVFYLLTYLSKRWQVPHTYLFIFMVLLGCGARTFGLDLPFLNGSSCRGYYAFFFGVLLAEWLERLSAAKRSQNIYIFWGSVAAVALLLCLMVYKWAWVASGINFLMTFCFYPALIIIFSSKPLVRLFDHKFIGILGKITYDTYIWHCPNFLLLYIIPAITGRNWDLLTAKAMLVFTMVSFAVGAVSYYALERPISGKLRKLTGTGG